MGKLPNEFLSLQLEYKSGASEKFEEICEELMQAKYGANAHRITPHQGDWGIDIIIGDFSSPCTVCQCKFFSENIAKSQQNQIRNSFKRAVTSEKYSMEKWVLFLANDMNKSEFDWWSDWKSRQETTYGIKIELCEGTNLINCFDERVRRVQP